MFAGLCVVGQPQFRNQKDGNSTRFSLSLSKLTRSPMFKCFDEHSMEHCKELMKVLAWKHGWREVVDCSSFEVELK